jgi:putative addiction module CopG family antidote
VDLLAVEQMNVSLSTQMARFIRGKVKRGEYTNISEVVRDAVRRMQEMDAAREERTRMAEFESGVTAGQHSEMRRSVQRGIQDIEAGRYEEYDADGLRRLARELVDQSSRKTNRRTKK